MNMPVAFAQILKVDIPRQLVWGRATQESPDSADEIMDYEKSVPHFKSWSAEMNKATGGLSNGNLRSMHSQVCAGKINEIIYNDEERAIDIVAHVVDPVEFEKVTSGCYAGFSIGGSYGEKTKEGKYTKFVAKPSEISLVDKPCLKNATFFDVMKADGIMQKVEFKNQGTLAKSSEATDELNADHPAVDVAKAAEDVEYQVKGTSEDADALAKLLHDNKLSIRDAVKAIQATTEAPLIADLAKRYEGDEVDPEFMADLLTLEKVAARADVNPKAGESKYGDVKFADEKNNKYPIENEAHIRAAWNYINKAANSAKYSADDLSAIKGKIVAAWKAKIDKAGPPSAEKALEVGDLEKRGLISDAEYILDMVKKGYEYDDIHKVLTLAKRGYVIGDIMKQQNSTIDALLALEESNLKKVASTGDLTKGISDCGRLGEMLQGLYYMAMCCKRESMSEGDNSPIPARLAALVTELADIYKSMSAEEADELLAEMNEEDAGIVSQASVMQMAAGLILPLMKAGARNSAADKATIQAMHDMSGKLGADCSNNTEKMMAENELTKSTDELLHLHNPATWNDPTEDEVKMLMEANGHLKGNTGLEKGDFVGHEFHGNQHTGGGGATKASEASGKAHSASMTASSSKEHAAAAAHHKEAASQHTSSGNANAAAYHSAMAGYHNKTAANKARAGKSIDDGDLVKVDIDNLAKADFTKMLADAIEPLKKALGAANEEIKMLKAQPMPARGVLRVVSKTNDVVETESQPEIAKVRKADGTVDEAATMMKKIFATGGHPVTGGHL